MPRRITFIGDSVAASLAPSLATTAATHGIATTSRTVVGCGVVTNSVVGLPEGGLAPFMAGCPFPATEAQRATPGDRPDLVLVLSTWETDERFDQEAKRDLAPGTDAWRRSLEEGLEIVADRVSAGGADVMFLLEPPRVEGSQPVGDGEATRAHAWADLEREWASRHGHLVTDLAPAVCGGRTGDCPVSRREVRLRPDDGRHFVPEGADTVAPDILDAILETWKNRPDG